MNIVRAGTWTVADPTCTWCPVDPCGRICDFIKRPYRTLMRFGTDPDQAVLVQWMFCQDTAEPLPWPTPFCSRDYCKWEAPWPEIGEIQYCPRLNTPDFDLTSALPGTAMPCGDPEVWQYGYQGTVPPIFPRNAFGHTFCCGGPTGVVNIGLLPFIFGAPVPTRLEPDVAKFRQERRRLLPGGRRPVIFPCKPPKPKPVFVMPRRQEVELPLKYTPVPGQTGGVACVQSSPLGYVESVQWTTTSPGTGPSFSHVWTTATTLNNSLFMVVSGPSGMSVTPPSGYSLITSQTWTAAGRPTWKIQLYVNANASSRTSETWTFSASFPGCQFVAMETNSQNTSPVDQFAFNNGTGTSMTAGPTAGLAGAEDLSILFTSEDIDLSIDPSNHLPTYLGGFSCLGSCFNGSPSGPSLNLSLGPKSPASQSAAATSNNTVFDWGALLVEVKP